MSNDSIDQATYARLQDYAQTFIVGNQELETFFSDYAKTHTLEEIIEVYNANMVENGYEPVSVKAMYAAIDQFIKTNPEKYVPPTREQFKKVLEEYGISAEKGLW
ncbi:hypothetical protein PCC8801_0283 [Rippkaea orientalis PCC 8801]|uniref:Uncharacterized protein n=1 Tax=Rippkaea orientalis (strain PCC 8801 / RF-1) TaxID=41431 RepID=B7K363_RIPO1|nr:hypothetical protein [Rippkaea orientalis]ACK64383.1 hypothetical protein PCC8801_0283 [Rippkaea orientalis PCC 8801]